MLLHSVHILLCYIGLDSMNVLTECAILTWVSKMLSWVIRGCNIFGLGYVTVTTFGWPGYVNVS
jgi:hypothetical protein